MATGVRAVRVACLYGELSARCDAPGRTGARLGSHEASLVAK